ncbi:hypothetical protein, partial [Streptomyces niveus]|uniref:hypothetical protein n=1 Tax=Streptomyces niveus TaxID=193462 RepID=UPI00367DFE6F
MTATNREKYRRPSEKLWTDGMLTEPVGIAARTEWLYSEYNPKILQPEGRTCHALSRIAKGTQDERMPSVVAGKPQVQDDRIKV